MSIPTFLSTLSLSTIILSVVGAAVVALFIRIKTLGPYDPLPVIGHLRKYTKSRQTFFQFLVDSSKHHGFKSWRIYMPGQPVMWLISDPACVKQIVTNKHSSFDKTGSFMKLTGDFLGESSDPPSSLLSSHLLTLQAECKLLGLSLTDYSILNVTGPAWKAQRVAGQTFSSPETLAYIGEHIIPRNIDVLFDPLTRAAASGETIDFQYTAAEFTLAAFADIAFDVNIKDILASFADPYNYAMTTVIQRLRNPLWKLRERFLPEGEILKKEIKRVQDFSRDLVEQKKDEIRDEEIGNRPPREQTGILLKGLLNSDYDFSDEELAAACFGFLIAGHDTTSVALSWILHAILIHPEYLAPILAEMAALPATAAIPMAELASHLPLLDAFINECLRLYPPAPVTITDNTSGESVPLPDGSVIAPGNRVLISAYVMARSSAVWGPDAESFRPERWAELKGRRKTAYELTTFHAGPRNCVGQQLARMEMVWTTKVLLENYEIEKAWEGGEREVWWGLTATVRGGLPVKVKLRN